MPEPGWYEDPGRPGLRWWDGERWTLDTAPLDEAGASAPASAGMLGTPVPTAPSPTGPARRLPLILGITAVVVVVGVVISLVAATGHHTGQVSTRSTSPLTAPNVTAPTTATTAGTPTTATTVPEATGAFVAALETGPHPVTGYTGHAATLVGFGRAACGALDAHAPVTAAWYGTITPAANGTTAVPPLAGAALVADAARYLCPGGTLVSRTARLVDRVDALPAVLRRGGVAASADKAAAGITAYACDLFLTGSDARRVTTELQAALHTGRYALTGHLAGLATSVGIQAVCPARLPEWLRGAGGKNL